MALAGVRVPGQPLAPVPAFVGALSLFCGARQGHGFRIRGGKVIDGGAVAARPARFGRQPWRRVVRSFAQSPHLLRIPNGLSARWTPLDGARLHGVGGRRRLRHGWLEIRGWVALGGRRRIENPPQAASLPYSGRGAEAIGGTPAAAAQRRLPGVFAARIAIRQYARCRSGRLPECDHPS